MNARTDESVLGGGIEPDEALEVLNRISGSLLESYREIAARAERVEQELEVKVAELDDLSRHLEAILDALPTGVIVRDAEQRIVRVNRAAGQILDRPATGLIECDDALFDDQQGSTHTWTRADGSLRTVVRREAEVLGSDDRPSGSVEILDDQTELTRLTERVHRMDKLAALGNVAAGIAHEIRNPLNAIKGFAGLMKSGMAQPEKAERWAGLIVEGVGEIETIVSSMLSFARPEGLEPSTIEAVELIAEAVELVREHAGRDDRTAIEQDVEPLVFVGDRIKLRQAVRNLIANACDARRGTGRVRVAVRRSADDVLVAVSDDGPGFPTEARDRAFDPFFTTRAEGTGLGLSLVNTIAELHGGQAAIDESPSELGGARVSFSFPLRDPHERSSDRTS